MRELWSCEASRLGIGTIMLSSSLLHDNLPNPHRAEPVPMLSAASVRAACAGDFYSWVHNLLIDDNNREALQTLEETLDIRH